MYEAVFGISFFLSFPPFGRKEMKKNKENKKRQEHIDSSRK